MEFFLLTGSLHSQVITNKGFFNRISTNWTLDLNYGVLIFYGDIKEKDFIPVSRPKNELCYGFSTVLAYRFNDFFSLGTQYLSGRLCGVNTRVNRYFTADIQDVSLQGILTLNDLIFNMNREKVEVYAMLGAGFLYFRSVQKDLLTDSVINVQGYEMIGMKAKKKTTEFMIPVGLGIKVNLNQFNRAKKSFSGKWYATASFCVHTPGTDKLDAELSPIKSGRDSYSYFSVGLTYRFGPVQRTFSRQAGGRAMRNELRKISEQVKKMETGYRTASDIKSPVISLPLPFINLPEISVKTVDLEKIPANSNHRLFFNPELIQLTTSLLKEVFKFADVTARDTCTREIIAYIPIEDTNVVNVFVAKRRLEEIFCLLTGTIGIPASKISMSIYLYSSGKNREAIKSGSVGIYDIVDLNCK
ncbi:MAG: hypothetical protein NTU44_03705 [Bacteroidetes bacterium]|nr:hypothetical protein [Bacteroidota bacterium]